MAFDPEKIEKAVDRVVTANIELTDQGSGIAVKRLVDAMEIAKVMALSKQAIPLFMRDEPGLCYAAVVRSVRWRMDPYFVAENMFLMRNPKSGEERIGFMAQLINAVINASEATTGRLRVRYEGSKEDGTLKGIVYATPKGETDPLEYETPTLGDIIKHLGRNERGQVKGSPLYDLDPKQQLWYYGSKNFIRKWYPDVLAGCYDREDFSDWDEIKDVTPKAPPQQNLMDRLKAKRLEAVNPQARGFDADQVERHAASASNGDNHEETDNGEEDERRTAGRHGAEDGSDQPGDDRGSGEADIEGATGRADLEAGNDEGDAARGSGAEGAQAQAELPPPEGDGGKRKRSRG